MLVFWQQKLALLATPKTGTTAIESALESLAAVVIQRPPQLKHTSVQKFHRFIGPYLETTAGAPFTVVAVMREPLDWLGSWYRYRQRDDIGNVKKSTADLTFEEFITAYCSDSPPDFADVGSQARFLQPKSGRGLDHLFRYEEIDKLIEFLEDRLGCEIILPRLNVSPMAEMQLSTATYDRLRDFAHKDFALYQSLT